jgi:spore coat protein U-like protein
MLLTFRTRLAAAVMVSAAAFANPDNSAFAATTTNTFNVQFVVTADCLISSAGALNFGTSGLLNANIDATSTINVQCTNTTPYNVGLNGGSTVGGTTATRLMSNGTSTVDYRLYSNAGRTTNWGETVGTDTVSQTGSGSAQSFTVYGRIPTQTSVEPGTYTDTITVTVTY